MEFVGGRIACAAEDDAEAVDDQELLMQRLPKKARSARAAKRDEPAPALLTYFRRGRLEKFFAAEPNGIARELDFFAIARLCFNASMMSITLAGSAVGGQ